MEKEKWFKESTKNYYDKQADKWLELNSSTEKNVVKSDANGILSERQLRRLSEEYETPISHFQADDEHNIFDWIQGQKNVEVVKESLPTTKVADKEYVVSIVQSQVKAFMNSGESDKVTENQAMAFELVYNQGMTLTDASKVMDISVEGVRKNLIKLFTLAKVELYCGINVKDKVLERFYHPSVLALRNAKQRYSSLPKVSKPSKKVQVVGIDEYTIGFVLNTTDENLEYGLNAPVFTWTVQDGSNNNRPSTLTTEEKDLPATRGGLV